MANQYQPTLHTGINKPYGLGLGLPTDARSFYYDPSPNFRYRPYTSPAEAIGYLPVQYREGKFTVFVQSVPGAQTKEYWWRDGTADLQLIEKGSTITYATDLEMEVPETTSGGQITEDVPPKVTSRAKVFHYWWWIKRQVQTVTGKWTFNLLKLAQLTTAPANEPGIVWFQNFNFQANKTGFTAEAVLTSFNNDSLKGIGERVMSAGPTGGPQATHALLEQIVIDTDIINACKAGAYDATNGYTSTVTPIPASKLIYKGQFCRSNTAPWYLYFAIDDNRVARIPLG